MAKFVVDYRFMGRASNIIEAATIDDARERIEAEVEADDFSLDVDDFDDVDFDIREMHPVTRDGKEIWTTSVQSTDSRGHQSALAETPLFAEAAGKPAANPAAAPEE